MECEYLKTLSLISLGPEKKICHTIGVLSGWVYGLRLQEAAFLNEDPGFKVLNLFEFICNEISLTTNVNYLILFCCGGSRVLCQMVSGVASNEIDVCFIRCFKKGASNKLVFFIHCFVLFLTPKNNDHIWCLHT